MKRPHFNREVFKHCLVKKQIDYNYFTLDEFKRIIEYIKVNKDTDQSVFPDKEHGNCLENNFNIWYDDIQANAFGISKEYIENTLEGWHEMFVESLIADAYEHICYDIVYDCF